jgi:hypothetical protein
MTRVLVVLSLMSPKSSAAKTGDRAASTSRCAWISVCSVRCIYLYIVVSPYVRGLPAYLYLYLYYILWPLAPR